MRIIFHPLFLFSKSFFTFATFSNLCASLKYMLMKNINHSFLNGFNWLLAGLLSLFGFANCVTSKKVEVRPPTRVMIMYGAPAANFIKDINTIIPLYIIDGKEVSEEEFSKLNVEDIESCSVLKDAAAIEKYAEKGKNGVVIITLKKKE